MIGVIMIHKKMEDETTKRKTTKIVTAIPRFLGNPVHSKTNAHG